MAEPEFTDTARAALLWVLWHHQGGSSPTGQAVRFALGMGQFDQLTPDQVAQAKAWAPGIPGLAHTDHAGVQEVLAPSTDQQRIEAECLQMIEEQPGACNTIAAIKHYRNCTGCGLREAKDAVDTLVARKLASGVRVPEQPRHDNGDPAPEDNIAKCKRILAAVDAYHEQPTQATRSDLRHAIYAELERAACGVPEPRAVTVQEDAVLRRAAMRSAKVVAAGVAPSHGETFRGQSPASAASTRDGGEAP